MTYNKSNVMKMNSRKRAHHADEEQHKRTSGSEWIILLVFLILNSVPILWGLSTSFKSTNEILAYPPKFLGFTFTLDHYAAVFRNGLTRGMLNSLLYSGGAIVFGVFFGLLAGYGFQRYRFPFKKLLFYIVVAGIPLSTGSSSMLIPTYLYMMKMGLTNKWYTLILIYTAYNLPMAVWILKGAIEAIPLEIEDAARIDGCSRAYIILRLVPRMCLPSLASAALFLFIGSWNEFITSAVMIDSAQLRPIQSVIYYFNGFFGTDWGALMAAAMVALLPIVIVFSLLGKLMVSGLTQGAVKG